jgi:hypothetical protein
VTISPRTGHRHALRHDTRSTSSRSPGTISAWMISIRAQGVAAGSHTMDGIRTMRREVPVSSGSRWTAGFPWT